MQANGAVECVELEFRSAVADADFVQENVPEQLEMKQQLYREIDPVLPAAAVVASSTSALSTAQGPAIMANDPPPMRTRPTETTESSA